MIHVLVKTIWGELLSLECHKDDSVETIAKILHETDTENFPRIPLVKQDQTGSLQEGEVLFLVPYPHLDAEISLLCDAVFGDFDLQHGNQPIMAMYELYEAKIQTGFGFFYLPFLVFTFKILQGRSKPRMIYEPFLPSFRPLNQAATDLFQKMSESSPAFSLKEGDWEDGPIVVDGELVHAVDPWIKIDPRNFQEMNTICDMLAQECMKGMVEERVYMEAYLKEVLLEKWKVIEASRY